MNSAFKPTLKCVEADKGASGRGEGLVDVEPAFVADGEAAEAGYPAKYALNDPTVLTQPLAALDATPDVGTTAAATGTLPRTTAVTAFEEAVRPYTTSRNATDAA